MSENEKMDPKVLLALKGVYDSLTDEQKEKAKNCKDVNELISALSEMGVALPDELLNAVTGGASYSYNSKKKCWEIILKDGRSVIESDIGSKKDAMLIADFWTFLEDQGEI